MATIDVAEAAEGMWDVAVVGAGPAGSAMAAHCAALGARTALIDRANFPRAKVCGCCLAGRGVAIVEGMLGDGALAQLGARPLRRLLICSRTHRATLRLDGGMSISRATLDAAMVAHAARAGAAVLLGTSATLDPHGGRSSRELILACGGRMRARVVVAADGLAGRLLDREPGMAWRIAPRSRMGASCIVDDPRHPCATGEVVMSLSREGYVGLTRLEDGTLDVAGAFSPAALRAVGRAAAIAARMLHESGIEVPAGLATARWRGAPALTRTRRVAGRRVLVVGDSAGYVEPFTGEGMTWALESAMLAAPMAVVGASDWRVGTERAWLRTYARAIGRRHIACRIIASTLRRPKTLNAALSALDGAPHIGDAIARAMHGRRASA